MTIVDEPRPAIELPIPAAEPSPSYDALGIRDRRRAARRARAGIASLGLVLVVLVGYVLWVAITGARDASRVDDGIRVSTGYDTAELLAEQERQAQESYGAAPSAALENAFEQAASSFSSTVTTLHELAGDDQADLATVERARTHQDAYVAVVRQLFRAIHDRDEARIEGLTTTAHDRFYALDHDLSQANMAKVAVAEVVAGSMRDSTSLVRTVTPGVIGVSLTVVLIALLLMRDYRRLEERTNVRGQQRLARSAARFQSLVENSADVIMVIHSTRGMSYASPASRRILGYEPSELMTISREQLVHSDDLALYSAARDRCGEVPGSLVGPLELRLRHQDDTWRCMQVSLSNHLDDPTVGGYVVNAHDITDLKAAEADLVHGVTHDSLTGLPNRTLFLDRLSVSVARSDRRAATALVMVCGVDGFKLINESLGLPAGDAVLVTVGQRIRAAMRPADTVARFGGDEFVICCENVVDEQDAHAFACRVIRALDKPINVEGNEVFVTVSVGVRLAPATATVDGLEDILRDADVAMYQAKSEGRGGIKIFCEPLGERTQRRLEIESGLHHALERDEFRVHYQPTMSIHDGRFTGVEALVRWEHPERGMRAPGDFIGIAEETGLIVPIGLWVLDEACQQLRRWNELGSGPMTMAVNLSPRQLSSPQLVDRVAEIIARSRVRPEDLTLEITENALMQDVAAAEIVLRALKALGLRLAIDDFGTGYSSLGYLRRFPIDILKIDQSFVAQLGTDAHSTAIVTSVIHLAAALDLDVVAEGVETREQLAQLELLGCQLAQGYYWSKPVPPDEITLGLKLTGAASSITEMSGDGKIRVLVADDEASHRAAVKRILERSDRFTVVAEAVDGREAVRMAQQERPDLVVLDLSMPNMGGLEALPRILASSPGTKVALLSGHAGDPTVAEGASHHLRKGAKPAELVEDLLLVMGAVPSADS